MLFGCFAPFRPGIAQPWKAGCLAG